MSEKGKLVAFRKSCQKKGVRTLKKNFMDISNTGNFIDGHFIDLTL